MHQELKYVIRPAREGDIAFIFSTWLKGLYHGNNWFRAIESDIFFKHYHEVVAMILKLSVVSVACLPEDVDVVLGYSVSQGPILHWVFVKKAWRKAGIARALVPKDVTICTHLTKLGQTINNSQANPLKFNPFLIGVK